MNQQPKAPPISNGLMIWFFVFIFVVTFTTMVNNNKEQKVKELTFSEVIGLVKEKKVTELTFQGNKVLGKTKDEKGAVVDFESFGDTKSDYYLQIFGENGVTPKYVPEEVPGVWANILMSFLPLILIFVVAYFVIKGMKNQSGRAMSFGKLNLTNQNDKTTVTFKDVAGMDEAKEELTEIVDFLKNPSKYTNLGGTIPKGALLVGPPGTGKTMIAKATANEAGVPFFALSGSDFIEMFVGVGASRVRDLFEQARKSAPCIVFIDEIDAVAKQRSGGQFGSNSEMDQTLNQLLVEMDGIDEKNKQIIVLAATNRVDILDQALLRPGRFDRRVTISLPDIKGREQILQSHARNKKLSPNVNFHTLAKGTAGMSGADISNLLNEAAIFAARSNKPDVDMESIEKAKDKILMGTERRTLVISPEEKKKTAIHESGHAIITRVLKLHSVYKVSIIPRGRALGVTQITPDDDQVSFTKQKALDFICMLMGGRAAEDHAYSEFTTGASDDIKRATDIAKKMVTEWGMSDNFGPMNVSQPVNAFEGGAASQETLKKVDEEVKSILSTCYVRTKKILEDNWTKVEAMTSVLLEKETITGDEIELILK